MTRIHGKQLLLYWYVGMYNYNYYTLWVALVLSLCVLYNYTTWGYSEVNINFAISYEDQKKPQDIYLDLTIMLH